MNIAIGKIGKSCLFDPNKWGAVGGDNEPSLIYLALAKFFPEHTFYMIGKSDIKANRHRIPNNIVDAWLGYKPRVHDYTYPYHNTATIKFDGGIFMSGLSTTMNIPSEKVKPLSMFKNATAPIYNFINNHKLDYMLIAPDPRYIKNGYDLIIPPKYCFSQYSYTHSHKHYTDYRMRDMIQTSFEVEYKCLEKAFMIGGKPHPQNEKTERLNVILNQKGAFDRGPELLKYIQDEPCNVYGKWSVIPDERFKGPVKFIELRRKLLKTKYTIIIPTDKGWVTSKYWEMIHMGVIPFMHPYYDTQNNLDAPRMLRVESAKEFKEKMDYFDSNEDERKEFVQTLQSRLYANDYTGEFLAHVMMDSFRTKVLGWR